jgi:hypothetical protein
MCRKFAEKKLILTKKINLLLYFKLILDPPTKNKTQSKIPTKQRCMHYKYNRDFTPYPPKVSLKVFLL